VQGTPKGHAGPDREDDFTNFIFAPRHTFPTPPSPALALLLPPLNAAHLFVIGFCSRQ